MVDEQVGSCWTWLLLQHSHIRVGLHLLLVVVGTIHTIDEGSHWRRLILRLEGRAVVEVVLTFIEDFPEDCHLRLDVHWVGKVLCFGDGVILLLLEPYFDGNVTTMQKSLTAQQSNRQQRGLLLDVLHEGVVLGLLHANLVDFSQQRKYLSETFLHNI